MSKPWELSCAYDDSAYLSYFVPNFITNKKVPATLIPYVLLRFKLSRLTQALEKVAR